MKLSDVSIERPVFATMMVLALVVLGLFSYIKLSIDQYPNVDFPFVTITTILAGAGPEQMETEVTKKVEDAANTVEGVNHITSYSQEGVSIVVIEFKLEIDGRSATQDVRDKVAAIRADMPDGIEDPIIQRFDPASQPIFSLTVSGKRPEKEITTYTRDVIKKRVENVPGVGNVEVVGGAEREVNIEVDAVKLQAYKLSIQDVITAISISNMEVPAGSLIQGKRQILLRTIGKFKNVVDFNKVIVTSPGGKPVYLSDVARVVDGVKERTSLTRYNGISAVSLEIKKQSGGNTVEVADAIRKQFAKIQQELPADLTISIARDNSTRIRDSVNDVLFDIFYGGFLAVVVVFLFLANMRATIISAIALPTSIIASFIVMYALNFTLNMMSLLALSLAVGLLIDDAIVVIENIYRHMKMGKDSIQAAKDATAEIGLAVMATTFTIVAVFVPVAFIPGLIGRFFFQFGITVSVSVLVSLFVAFTLTPMLSSRWLDKEDEEYDPKKAGILKRFLHWFNHQFEVLSERYKGAIRWSLTRRFTVLFGAIAVFFLSLFCIRFLGTSFFPSSDESEFTMNVQSAPGSSLEQTSDLCQRIEKLLNERKEVTSILTTIGAGNDPVTKASILVKVVKKKDRDKSTEQISDEIRKIVTQVPGATVDFTTSHGPGGAQKMYAMSIRGPNIDTLKILSDKVEKIVRQTKGTVDISNSLTLSKPEYRIRIDRDRASELGLNVASIASSVRAMVDGAVASQYQEGDEQYDVRVRLAKKDRTWLEDIRNLAIKGNKDDAAKQKIVVPVGYVASVDQAVGPSKIDRYDRQREIRVEANLLGRQLGEVMADVQKETAKIQLPVGYTMGVVGMGEMQKESFSNILLSLFLAIIFVYIVLAAQFESFTYPFAIMFALPMSLIGAVIALIIFHSALSVMSLIGIIMLMGLVTKNGILLVDYTNTLRGHGHSRTEALIQAGATRLRPILMTTFAMIFGMVPVAFAMGEGSEFRSPMGQAVIGGLITSTFLTLFIVPVVYSLIDDFTWKKLFRKLHLVKS